jgi:hypothetical protein
MLMDAAKDGKGDGAKKIWKIRLLKEDRNERE